MEAFISIAIVAGFLQFLFGFMATACLLFYYAMEGHLDSEEKDFLKFGLKAMVLSPAAIIIIPVILINTTRKALSE